MTTSQAIADPPPRPGFCLLDDGSRTAGLLGGWTTTATRGCTQLLRAHTRAHAAVVVLEGRCLLALGHEERDLGAGDAVLVPAGVPHRLQVRSDIARWLTVTSPAGPETLEAALAAAMPADTEALLGLAAECGVELWITPDRYDVPAWERR
jgi:hypothetical protein